MRGSKPRRLWHLLRMESCRRTLFFTALIFSLTTHFSIAQDDAKKDGNKKETAPPNSNELFKSDFNDLEVGDIPSNWMALDGEWSVIELDGSKVLQLSPDPLVEASIQFGKSVKGEGATATVRVKANRKRRTAPRFGLGLHGGNGFHFRVVGVTKKIELKKGDDIMQSVDFDWRPGEWHFMELTVKPADTAWTVSGKIWAESDEKPEQNQLEYIATDVKLSGKVSVLATPYAGLPIYFDDLTAMNLSECAE